MDKLSTTSSCPLSAAADSSPNARSMTEHFSPKQVARAIGVSESSLKRWCDRGLIPMAKTVGGHRRLPLDGVMEFLRSQGHALQHPELLGLPATVGQTDWTLDRAQERLRAALVEGDEEVCLQIVVDIYLAGHPVCVICDRLITAAFHEIGEMWECGNVEVYEERRACELCLRIVHELRRMVNGHSGAGPLALGGTLDGDPYTLAVSMAELVLRDTGWNAHSLGHLLPFETVKAAIERDQPRLLWLSVSAIRDQTSFAEHMLSLFEVAHLHRTAVVLGGKALHPELRRQLRYSTYCDTFQHLADFASLLRDELMAPETRR
jgi:MerR family transcriptional regulator, light-induced transcriptional regulator